MGAVVIVNRVETKPTAIGIITKSDILQAYREQVDIKSECMKIMGGRKLVSCHPEDDRDRVARILVKNKTHHVVVVDGKYSRFVGLVSSWDIAAECTKDNSAWPYLRGEDGKIPFPENATKSACAPSIPAPEDIYDPEKPTTILNHPHDKATTYMDALDMENFQ